MEVDASFRVPLGESLFDYSKKQEVEDTGKATDFGFRRTARSSILVYDLLDVADR